MPDKKNANDTLDQGIIRMIKILKTFEKLTYATDPYLGNLSVSPANLGTSMRLSCDVRLEDTDMSNPSISKKKISPELLQKF
jgi:protein-arginine kinase